MGERYFNVGGAVASCFLLSAAAGVTLALTLESRGMIDVFGPPWIGWSLVISFIVSSNRFAVRVEIGDRSLGIRRLVTSETVETAQITRICPDRSRRPDALRIECQDGRRIWIWPAPLRGGALYCALDSRWTIDEKEVRDS